LTNLTPFDRGAFRSLQPDQSSNSLRANNVYGEGPSPLPTFLAPVSGITNAEPARQLQFAWRVLFQSS
jgi:hypothetical protein